MHLLPLASVPLDVADAPVLPDVFDLDRYLDGLAPYLVESFQRRIAGRTIYELLSKQPQPVLVSLRAFLAGLTRFRAKIRGLDPKQRALLAHRVAELFPESNVSAPGFALTVLQPTDPTGSNPEEAGGRV